jgi:hypoxanthine phosphoribosyltransferase
MAVELPRGRETRLVFSWRDVERALMIIRDSIEQQKLTIACVIPVSRGDLVPAAMLAYSLGVGVGGILMRDREGVLRLENESFFPYPGDIDQVLVVDDIIDSGTTMTRVRTLLPDVKVATVIAHVGMEALWDACGYVVDPDVWVTWPWSPDDYRGARG